MNAPTGSGRLLVHEDFASAILSNRRTLRVHLPPGYEEQRERRYPVVYLHDGQNVFEDATAAFGVSWRAGETADRLALSGRIAPLLLVGIDNTLGRHDEYTFCRDEWRQEGGRADEYGRFVFEEVKPFIDQHYRTQPGRDTTAVAGSSLGGLASLTIARAHHRQFSRCGLLSPSLWWADSSILSELETSDLAWMHQMRWWLCMGSREGTQREPVSSQIETARRMAALFDRAGLLPGRDYLYQEIVGGEHTEAAWAARLDRVLLYLFGW